MILDSADTIEFDGPSFPMSFCEKWFPAREDVLPERFTVVLPPNVDDDDDFHSADVDHLEELLQERFIDVNGDVCHPRTEELRSIEEWEDEWDSTEPPVRPEPPSLGEYLEAKAKLEASMKENDQTDEIGGLDTSPAEIGLFPEPACSAAAVDQEFEGGKEAEEDV